MNERYWVGSNAEMPEKLYFNKHEAFSSGHSYIDSFDDEGEHVASYKLVGDTHTTDF